MIHFCSCAQSGEQVFQLHQEALPLQRGEILGFSSQMPHLVPVSAPKSAETAGFILQTFTFPTSTVTGMISSFSFFLHQYFPPSFLDKMVGDPQVYS